MTSANDLSETAPGESAVNRMRTALGKPTVGPQSVAANREELLTRAWEEGCGATGTLVLMGVRRKLNKAALQGARNKLAEAVRLCDKLLETMK